MSKESEIIDFLNHEIFDPVLFSPKSSLGLKRGIRMTKTRLKKLRAEKMVQYFWTAILGTERSTSFYERMKEEGFTTFEDKLAEFRERFNDAWLKS